jgi:alkaline phosphatase D
MPVVASSRREFLRNAAVASAGLLVGCNQASLGGLLPPGGGDGGGDDGGDDGGTVPPEPPEKTPESMAFPLGIASGDVTEARAMLWARHDGTGPLQVVLWEMNGAVYAREVLAMDVMRAEGGFVHVDVDGLQPGLRYRYAFFEMDGGKRAARSPIGRFRASISAELLEPLVLGAVSCTSNGRAFDTLARAGAREDLDGFLLVGDTAYCDGAKSRADYRAKWQQNLSTAGYRAIRQATSVVATWDDHEFDNDWNPETFDGAQKLNATSTFYEHLPVRRDPANPERLWRRLRWGKTLEIFALDCRSERKPSTRNTANAEYVSKAQLDWLKAGLTNSTAMFKLILNSVPIGSFPGAFQFANQDRWEGYPAQRTELLTHIDMTALTGVLFVSGDFHVGSMGRVGTTGPGAGLLEILAGPGGQTANPLSNTLNPPQFDYATGTNNYTVLHFFPQGRMLRVVFHDGTDKIIADRSFFV